MPLGTFVGAANGWGRTDTTSPSFLIEASGGILKCATDDSATQSCGPAPATCAAAVCALYSPGPLGNGDHTVYAEADQSDDETEGGAEYDFDVDLTPPELLTDGLVPQAEVDQPRPPHPTFHFSTYDDDENASSTPPSAPSSPPGLPPNGARAQAPAPSRWLCPAARSTTRSGSELSTTSNRPSKVLMLSYDPLPCTVGAAAPASSLSLELPRAQPPHLLSRGSADQAGPIPGQAGPSEYRPPRADRAENDHLHRQAGGESTFNLDIYPGTDNLLKSYRTVRLRLTATAGRRALPHNGRLARSACSTGADDPQPPGPGGP